MRGIIEAIDEFADIHPERVAFVTDGGNSILTYGQLRDQSDVIADWLLGCHDRSHKPVIVLGHKESEMLTHMLGCVKAGRPYIPVDRVSTPSQRIQKIVQAADVSYVLDVRTPIRGFASDDLRRDDVQGPAPFYIMFTSGSTGEPKGVIITRDNLEDFVWWMLGDEPPTIGYNEVILNQAPYSFDLSVMDTWVGLASGNTIWSLSSDEINTPRKLFASLRYSDLSIWVSTPSFVRYCLAEKSFDRHMLPSLRLFLFCGEVLSPGVVEELFKRFPSAQIWNTYGPTEATVAMTKVRITRLVLEEYSDKLPVGVVKRGTRVDFRDPIGQVFEGAMSGEIIITGPNVSPGYVNVPSTSFHRLPNGETSYRTGDLGYIRDGYLFVDGRIDRQVKVGGHRIELGEIESTIRSVPGVKDVVVLVVGVEPNRLVVAYVIENESISDWTIRHVLGLKLPPYMSPRVIYHVDEFPMTPNGKVDYKALERQTGPFR